MERLGVNVYEQERKEKERIKTGFDALLSSAIKERGKLYSFRDNAIFNMLYAVCRLLKIELEGEVIQKSEQLELEKAAFRLGIPTRKIVLEEGFSAYDAGIFAAKLDNGDWCLLYKERGVQKVFDPQNGKVVAYREDMALSREALMFYKPLSQNKQGLRSIFSFSFDIAGRQAAYLMLFSVFIGILNMLTPIFMGDLVNKVIPHANLEKLYEYGLGLMAFGIASSVFYLAKSFTIYNIEGKLSFYIQTAIWNKILYLPIGFFEGFKTADLIMRANGIDKVRSIMSGTIISTFLAGIFSLFSFLLLFYYNYKIALIILLFLVLVQAVYIPVVYMQSVYIKKYNDHFGELGSEILGYINSIQKIKNSASEDRAFANFLKHNKEQVRLRYISNKLKITEGMLDLFFNLFVFIFLFALVAFYFKLNAHFGIGGFIAFNAALGQFSSSFMSMSKTLIHVIDIIPYFKRLQPILEAKTEPIATKHDPGILQGKIELRSVSFKYAQMDKNLIDELSFTIEPGEYVAITGDSGSGKTTTAKLIMGFEYPHSGEILYDDKNITDLDLRALRAQLGVVLQDPELFDGDIYNNIKAGSSATREEVEEAVKLAGLEKDIDMMPMGLNTVLNAKASTLSGGQKQRIAIARALVKKPGIVLMDEATSALDNITQNIVTQTLKKMGATRIVIAHRISTLKEADRIMVLEKGKIVESGSYDELIAEGGYFASLVVQS